MLRQDTKHALFKKDVTNSYVFFVRFVLLCEFVLPAVAAGVMVNEDELDDELVLRVSRPWLASWRMIGPVACVQEVRNPH